MNGSEAEAQQQYPLLNSDPWQGQGPEQQRQDRATASTEGGYGTEQGKLVWNGTPAAPGLPNYGLPTASLSQADQTWGQEDQTWGQADQSWDEWQPRQRPTPNYFGDEDRLPPRAIHDNPPVWDGRDPDKQLEAYLKLLEGWIATTRTLKRQRGMVILNYAQGDLRLIINELDVADLTAEDGDRRVLDHVRGRAKNIWKKGCLKPWGKQFPP